MAQIIWSESALLELDSIAEYIALSNPLAASALVKKIIKKLERLELHPKSGKIPIEIPGLGYREVIAPPCRIFYREDDDIVYIVHIFRAERNMRKYLATI